MTKIDRAEVERVIDDLEAKTEEFVNMAKAAKDVDEKNMAISATIAFQYSISRLRELL